MRRLALIGVALACIAAPAAVAATCPKTTLADVENEVMCPVCGVPLALATEAPQAQRQRAFIERQVESCKSKQEIKDALVAQFGERVLALPPEKGFNLAAYLVPALLVVAGAATVAVVARRRRRTVVADRAKAAAPGLTRDDAARLEADLGRYDL